MISIGTNTTNEASPNFLLHPVCLILSSVSVSDGDRTVTPYQQTVKKCGISEQDASKIRRESLLFAV